MSSSLKKKTVHGVFWSSVDRFSTQGVNFLFGLAIARILSPAEYGMIAMLTIFIAVGQAFIDSGFSNALIRKTDRTETDNSTAFYFNIIVGIAAYFLLFFASPFIADFYALPILSSLAKVVGLTFFFNSLCVVQQAILSIKIDFKTQAKVSFSAAISSGILGLILAYKGFGVWALAVQSVSAAAIRSLLLWILAKWKPTERFSKASFHNLFSYGSKLLASSVLDIVYNNLYTIVIGKFFSASKLGAYARADQLAMFPSSNLTGILQRVTFPVLSTLQHEDTRLRINYRKILRLSAFIIFPLMIVLMVVAGPLIRLLLTDKWEGAIIFLQIICLSVMWFPIHAINLNLLQVKGRSDLFLRLEIFKKIIGVSLICITIPMGILAMCWGRVISSLLTLIINTYYTGKFIDMGFFRQMGDLFPILLNSLIMGGLVYGVVSNVTADIYKLTLGLPVGFFYFLLSSYLFKSAELKELLSIIKHK